MTHCGLMSEVSVMVAEFDQKRLQRFHSQLRECCKTSGTFRKQIKVGWSHIKFRASETSSMKRLSFNNETIASIVLNGVLNEGRSSCGPQLRIAIEARFIEFRSPDWDTMQELIFRDLAVRVVIQESKPKHFVVTVFTDDGSGNFKKESLPSISSEVWND
ncbi:MAG: hypothetical protein AB8C84_10725 [Oligoflexales bacterium]